MKLPSVLSKSAKSLLTSLLKRKPQSRIGAGPRGAEEIKEHEFFRDIDWQRIYKKEYRVPKPHIRNVKHNNPMAQSIFEDLG